MTSHKGSDDGKNGAFCLDCQSTDGLLMTIRLFETGYKVHDVLTVIDGVGIGIRLVRQVMFEEIFQWGNRLLNPGLEQLEETQCEG